MDVSLKIGEQAKHARTVIRPGYVFDTSLDMLIVLTPGMFSEWRIAWHHPSWETDYGPRMVYRRHPRSILRATWLPQFRLIPLLLLHWMLQMSITQRWDDQRAKPQQATKGGMVIALMLITREDKCHQ